MKIRCGDCEEVLSDKPMNPLVGLMDFMVDHRHNDDYPSSLIAECVCGERIKIGPHIYPKPKDSAEAYLEWTGKHMAHEVESVLGRISPSTPGTPEKPKEISDATQFKNLRQIVHMKDGEVIPEMPSLEQLEEMKAIQEKIIELYANSSLDVSSILLSVKMLEKTFHQAVKASIVHTSKSTHFQSKGNA